MVRIVAITPLPKAPEIVHGAINVQGRLVAVMNVRARFRLPERAVELSDQLIIARTRNRPVALLVDAVTGVFEYPQSDITAAQTVVPGTDYLAGIAKLSDGMVLIHDLERFLSLDEERRVDEALASA